MSKVIEFIKRDKKIILAAVAVGLVAAMVYGLYSSAVYASNMQNGIADNVLRLHVLANSNMDVDQALKLHVRDGVLDVMRGFLTGDENKADVIALIEKNMDIIAARAREVITEHGLEFDVNIYFSYEFFPTVSYEGVTLPVGWYDALRVEIGAGAGRNWWCVAFPPLCFVEETRPQTGLNNVLTAEQYELVLTSPDSNVRLQARFKVVEVWQGLRR
jgi:stage II sporulation protein R